IWINILTAPSKTSYKIKIYISFFEKILARNDIKIVVPIILMSEIINRIIRDVYFLTFAKKNNLEKPNIPLDYFKSVFRPSQEYIDSFNLIIDEFKSYSTHIEFINDGLGSDISKESIFENIDQHFDFNDNFYYQLALARNYKIVTDDKDFWRENVMIITENETLLNKQTKIHIAAQSGNKK
ncbi:MAG: hypothetical protein DCE86_07595, partial [Flavobacteriaceae bacterium]